MSYSQRIPSILFIGQSKPEVAKLIKSVTGVESNEEFVLVSNSWPVDCKYYTATINLKLGSFQTIPTSQDLVEALVILFDPKSESSLGALFAYADHLKAKKPDVCLAVCENFEGSTETYENITQFCSEYTFELIELSPEAKHIAGCETANEESARYESKEEYGSTRVLNALLANPWSGMKRKKWTPPGRTNAPEGEAQGAAAAEAKSESAKAEAK